MQKLRTAIEMHSHWSELEIYVERIEAHIESDFSLAVENAKALLESIGKEICSKFNVELEKAPSVNVVLKKSYGALGYSNDNFITSISGSLANIGQNIGNLRNTISPTSHGKTMEEIRERNSAVDELTREFLIESTIIVAVFLIKSFEDRKHLIPSTSLQVEDDLVYEELEDFNNFWDDAYGEFKMSDYSYFASEILFNMDYQAYKAEFKEYAVSDIKDESEVSK